MVDGINRQMGQSALAALSSSSDGSSSTDTIKNEIKSSGKSYSAQQIVDEYGISLSKAQQILDDIKREGNEGASQNAKSDIPDSPQLEESEPPSTITYRV